jgi:hypothetical protein
VVSARANSASKNTKKWFSANCKNILVAPVWFEPEFVEFARGATNLPDFRILNLFDWLDVRNAGSIDFEEFFLFVALLFAVESGQSTHFLYFHGKRVFALCKKGASQETLRYHRFARLAYALGMTDDLIAGLLKQYGVISFPEEIGFDRFNLYYFAILKNFDKVARAPPAVRSEFENTYTMTSPQCRVQ